MPSHQVASILKVLMNRFRGSRSGRSERPQFSRTGSALSRSSSNLTRTGSGVAAESQSRPSSLATIKHLDFERATMKDALDVGSPGRAPSLSAMTDVERQGLGLERQGLSTVKASDVEILAPVPDLACPRLQRTCSAILTVQAVSSPTPYTLHPTPYTLHPTPFTLHPTPSTS